MTTSKDLDELWVRHGITILVSHDGNVIAHMCDRAAAMRAGQIVDLMDRSALAVPAA